MCEVFGCVIIQNGSAVRRGFEPVELPLRLSHTPQPNFFTLRSTNLIGSKRQDAGRFAGSDSQDRPRDYKLARHSKLPKKVRHGAIALLVRCQLVSDGFHDHLSGARTTDAVLGRAITRWRMCICCDPGEGIGSGLPGC